MNWRRFVREQLPPLDVAAEREAEIVEELALQLESTYERARARGVPDDEAMRAAIAEVPDWAAFARTVTIIERPPSSRPVPGAGSGSIMNGFVQDIRYAVR